MLIKHSENIFWLLKNSSIEIEMYKLITKGRIQKKKITKIVNMVLSVVGGVAAFH